MSFNFDEIASRQDTSCVKWDWEKNEKMLPMWVADMDFKTAPAVSHAIKKRIDHGVFGYTLTPEAFYMAIVHWWKRRHGFDLQKEWIIPTSGVLPSLSAIIRAHSNPGDGVLLLTPVYDHFFATIQVTDRRAISSPLIQNNGAFKIDFADFEKKASAPSAKVLLLSNPHNPTGRVWRKDELEKLGEICLRHQVVVVSDEIHADLVHRNFKHVPFASLGRKFSLGSYTCCSPSKSFNLAGIQVAYTFSENESYRNSFLKILEAQETVFLNTFANTALVAAYNDGEEWLDALRAYIYDNYLFLKSYLETHLPRVKVTPLEATYLVWLDVSAYGGNSTDLASELKEKSNLWLNAGTMYGAEGEGFLRMNIGCPRGLLEEGLNRLKNHLEHV